MDWQAARFPQRLSAAAVQIILILLPFVVFAFLVHLLERFMSGRLAARFGWNSVLVTGWLGTPIHELSHAGMCLVFRHRVNEIVMFRPDPESGVLGYVQHSFTPGNWYQEIGNFFIGIAPLIGGTIVLVALLWIFFPDVARLMISGDQGSSSPSANYGSELESLGMEIPKFETSLRTPAAKSAAAEILETLQAVFARLFTLEHITSWRLWLFLYLVLCVTTHMAPSSADYHGAARGAIFCGVVLAGLWMLAAAFPSIGSWGLETIRLVLVPVVALLSLAILLSLVSSALVYLLTFGWDMLKG